MTQSSSKQLSESLAHQVHSAFENGKATETSLAETFQKWLSEILALENSELINELTNLACKETDSGRRAHYFKLARMVQGRIPKRQAPEVEPVS
jgi:hypothetical protein